MYVEDTYGNMINRLAEKNSTCKVICVGATLRAKRHRSRNYMMSCRGSTSTCVACGLLASRLLTVISWGLVSTKRRAIVVPGQLTTPIVRIIRIRISIRPLSLRGLASCRGRVGGTLLSPGSET
jgi:hypothetical protein